MYNSYFSFQMTNSQHCNWEVTNEFEMFFKRTQDNEWWTVCKCEFHKRAPLYLNEDVATLLEVVGSFSDTKDRYQKRGNY